MKKRAGYSEIKELLLSCYWRGCRDHGVSGWRHEEVCAWAYGEFEDCYGLQIENLMLEVASYVLFGCWYPDLSGHHRKEVVRMLALLGMDESMKELPFDESEEFVNDLAILKLV